MSEKKARRLRRARKTRHSIRLQGANRLCVFRTPRHIYAQIISPQGDSTLVSASTLEPEVRKQLRNGGNVEAAKAVGARIAQKALEGEIGKVAFDRSGHKYHGRVKALAEAAREAGLAI